MKVDVRVVKFSDMAERTFEVVQVIESLCEFCKQPVIREERIVKLLKITSQKEYDNLLTRQAAHDKVEVDIEGGRIYLYDHEYRCDFHPNCLKRS